MKILTKPPKYPAKAAATVISNNIYKGKRCFILGGGPSMANLDFSKLKNEITIGINKACLTYPVTINYSMDRKFYFLMQSKEYNQKWLNSKSIKIQLDHRDVSFKNDVVVLNRLKEKSLSLDINSGIYPGDNSGWGALNLALCFGCNPVYLLGYDFKVEKNKTHWHDGYEQDIEALKKRLAKYIRCFEYFSGVLANEGFKIINLNKNSALTCFDMQDIGNVVHSSQP